MVGRRNSGIYTSKGHAIALLLTAVRVEHELAERIKEDFGLTTSEFGGLGLDRKTLGWYLSKCNELNLVEILI